MIRFQDACGKTGKTVAVRLLPDTDLVEGIEAACEKNGIKYAYVTCFGSFKETGYMYLVSKPEAKVGAGYGDVLKCGGPIEFLNGTGVVARMMKNMIPISMPPCATPQEKFSADTL